MTVDRGVRAFAGGMVLLSVALTVWVNEYWILLTTFIGLNLLQSAFTGFCPPSMVLRKFGLKECDGDLAATHPEL